MCVWGGGGGGRVTQPLGSRILVECRRGFDPCKSCSQELLFKIYHRLINLENTERTSYLAHLESYFKV